MSFQDKQMQCFDCDATFTFTADEQAAYQLKGHVNAPKRCPACRQTRKERQASAAPKGNIYSYQSQRQMFPATCARCGKSTQVPFQPREGRPVYCRDCYNPVRVSR